MEIRCDSLSDVNHLASFLADHLKPGDVVLLDGDLGAGKTTLVSMICANLGFSGASSPTFSLIQQYPTQPLVYHLDLYRLYREEDVLSLDIDRILDNDRAIVFIEWSEKLFSLCPKTYLRITINAPSEDLRVFSFSGLLLERVSGYVE